MKSGGNYQRGNPRQSNVEFDTYLNQLLDSGSENVKSRVYVRSHLSPALPQLFKFVDNWLSERNKDQNGLKSKEFWQCFIGQIGFYIYEDTLESLRGGKDTVFTITPTANGSPSPSLRLDKIASKDHVVIHRQDIPKPRCETNIANSNCGIYENWVNLSATEYLADDRSVHAFRRKNYGVKETGTRIRHRFLFSIDEIWNVLNRQTDSTMDHGIALILTGGGVKAAYQTRLIDQLYNQDYLVNAVTESRLPEGQFGTLPVKHVIGTSGGALLWAFVAAIKNEDKPLALSKLLWQKSVNNGD